MPTQAKTPVKAASQEGIRAPSQKRSVERVEAILKAARTLIAAKGSAGLKIQDIAAEAGITAGSMYQYFPNKAAILQTLGERYLGQTAGMIEAKLQSAPQSRTAFHELLAQMFDQYYALHRQDPVMRDIWMGTHADKSLQAMDDADTRRNAEMIFPQVRHLFAKTHWPDVQRALLLVLSLSGTTVRLALTQTKSDGQKTIDMAKHMAQSLFDPYFDDRAPRE
ncbi:MAG: TetR/AcrR family transcriptional regulator [Pseudomonadota bacterium]